MNGHKHKTSEEKLKDLDMLHEKKPPGHQVSRRKFIRGGGGGGEGHEVARIDHGVVMILWEYQSACMHVNIVSLIRLIMRVIWGGVCVSWRACFFTSVMIW